MTMQPGDLSLSANFEVQKANELDRRKNPVNSVADLASINTWISSNGQTYLFEGFIATVRNRIDPEEDGLYMLKNLPYSTAGNWEKIGASSNLDTSSSYTQTFANADIVDNILTVTHSLGAELVTFAIYDNTGKYILPDETIITDSNTLSIDLTSFTPLTEEYKIIVLAQGGNPDVQPVSFYKEFTNTDLTDNKITFTHNLNSKGIICNVYDNLNTQIIPEEITLVDVNTLELDLGTHVVTDTFRIFIVAQGSIPAIEDTKQILPAANNGPLDLADNVDYIFSSPLTHLEIASMTGTGTLEFSTDSNAVSIIFTYPGNTLFAGTKTLDPGKTYLAVYINNKIIISEVKS